MKSIIIDNRMRECEKKCLQDMGYHLLELPRSVQTYPEISSHVDIFVCKINHTICVPQSIFDTVFKTNRTVKTVSIRLVYRRFGKQYPEDVKYNVCQIGNNVVHNFRFTDSELLNLIEKEKLQKIQISQGYSNCSIAVVDENAVIVTDAKIAETLRKYKIDVLYLEELPDIKLLNYQNKYSQMNGLIGGAMARIEDNMMVFGDLRKIDKEGKISDFVAKYHLEIIDFEGLDVIDYGGMVLMEI